MSKRSKHKDRQAAAEPAPAGGMAAAAAWPLYEVLLSRQWDTPGRLVTILVARQAPDATRLAAAFFIVDLGCLGVKRVQVKRFADEEAYHAGLRSGSRTCSRWRRPTWTWSQRLSTRRWTTPRTWASSPILSSPRPSRCSAGADPDRCRIPVPTGGPNGKPFFVNGPHDDVDRVLAQLRRVVGDGNFDYLISLGDQEF